MPVVSKELVFRLSVKNPTGVGTLTRTSTITRRYDDDRADHIVGPITPHYNMQPEVLSGCITPDSCRTPADRLRFTKDAILIDPPLANGEIFTYEVQSEISFSQKRRGLFWCTKKPIERIVFEIEDGAHLSLEAQYLFENENVRLIPAVNGLTTVVEQVNPSIGSMIVVYWDARAPGDIVV